MEWLFGILIVVVGGWFWMSGGWYARIVAGVVFVPLGAFGGAGVLSLIATPTVLPLAIIIGAAIGGTVGWYFAGWPRWYWLNRIMALHLGH